MYLDSCANMNDNKVMVRTPVRRYICFFVLCCTLPSVAMYDVQFDSSWANRLTSYLAPTNWHISSLSLRTWLITIIGIFCGGAWFLRKFVGKATSEPQFFFANGKQDAAVVIYLNGYLVEQRQVLFDKYIQEGRMKVDTADAALLQKNSEVRKNQVKSLESTCLLNDAELSYYSSIIVPEGGWMSYIGDTSSTSWRRSYWRKDSLGRPDIKPIEKTRKDTDPGVYAKEQSDSAMVSLATAKISFDQHMGMKTTFLDINTLKPDGKFSDLVLDQMKETAKKKLGFSRCLPFQTETWSLYKNLEKDINNLKFWQKYEKRKEHFDLVIAEYKKM
jgi:hypothetical protein